MLIAFLEGGLVQEYGWLTQAQLLDAVAIGQFTPGPILSTATFIGYVIEGIPGAMVATVGIFLPAFLFVGLLNPLISRLRASAWMSAFLDAVNAAAVALMLAVSVDIGRQVLLSWETLGVSAAAVVAVFVFRLGSVWVILGGALAGALLAFFV